MAQRRRSRYQAPTRPQPTQPNDPWWAKGCAWLIVLAALAVMLAVVAAIVALCWRVVVG